MKKNIVRLLELLHKHEGEYISGENISRDLGVSRTTIWKYIRKLRKKGYQIDSKSNLGYLLVKSSPNIIPEEVFLGLDTEEIGESIKYFAEIDSTNEKAKLLVRDGAKAGTVVIADKQNLGKGRLGREWFSPSGTGLWFSIILRPNFSPERAPFLTIIASLAVAEALNDLKLNAAIKWPNDILLQKKKVCGILSELSADLGGINYAIVGIGLNVNQDEFPEKIKDKATSLKIITGQKKDRVKLLQKILNTFERFYHLLLQEKDDKILELWKAKLNILNTSVAIKSSGKVFRGTAIDVSSRGELMVKNKEGEILSFWAGDASVISSD